MTNHKTPRNIRFAKNFLKFYAAGTLLYLLLGLAMTLNLTKYYFFAITLFAIYYIQGKNKYKHTKLYEEFKNLEGMNGYQFEEFLKRLFQANGYKVLHTPLSGDQGADLLLKYKNEKIAIQAKKYSQPIGNKALQEVLAAREYYRCDKGIVVSNNTYTPSAKELARKTNIELWSKKELKMLFKELQI